MTPRHGLTLIELLAATLILSAASALGSTVIRNARGVQHDANLTRQALLILAEYEYAKLQVIDEPLETPWHYIDTKNNRWRITTTHQPIPEDAAVDPRLPPLEWIIESAEVRGETGAYRVIHARRALVPPPPPPSPPSRRAR